jgi:hypothetical protein
VLPVVALGGLLESVLLPDQTIGLFAESACLLVLGCWCWSGLPYLVGLLFALVRQNTQSSLLHHWRHPELKLRIVWQIALGGVFVWKALKLAVIALHLPSLWQQDLIYHMAAAGNQITSALFGIAFVVWMITLILDAILHKASL